MSSRPYITFVFVGAHQMGMPLHCHLIDAGARLHSQTRTAPIYHLYAVKTSKSSLYEPIIQLARPDQEGIAIEIEVWDVPSVAVDEICDTFHVPLNYARIELEDGCSIIALTSIIPFSIPGLDISSFGGWRAYLATCPEVDRSFLNKVSST